jgi:hypothetical protein
MRAGRLDSTHGAMEVAAATAEALLPAALSALGSDEQSAVLRAAADVCAEGPMAARVCLACGALGGSSALPALLLDGALAAVVTPRGPVVGSVPTAATGAAAEVGGRMPTPGSDQGGDGLVVSDRRRRSRGESAYTAESGDAGGPEVGAEAHDGEGLVLRLHPGAVPAAVALLAALLGASAAPDALARLMALLGGRGGGGGGAARRRVAMDTLTSALQFAVAARGPPSYFMLNAPVAGGGGAAARIELRASGEATAGIGPAWFTSAGEVTIAALVRVSRDAAAAGHARLFALRLSCGYALTCVLTPTGLTATTVPSGGGGAVVVSLEYAPPPPGTWAHVAVTMSAPRGMSALAGGLAAGALAVAVNGVALASAPAPYPKSGGGFPWTSSVGGGVGGGALRAALYFGGAGFEGELTALCVTDRADAPRVLSALAWGDGAPNCGAGAAGGMSAAVDGTLDAWASGAPPWCYIVPGPAADVGDVVPAAACLSPVVALVCTHGVEGVPPGANGDGCVWRGWSMRDALGRYGGAEAVFIAALRAAGRSSSALHQEEICAVAAGGEGVDTQIAATLMGSSGTASVACALASAYSIAALTLRGPHLRNAALAAAAGTSLLLSSLLRRAPARCVACPALVPAVLEYAAAAVAAAGLAASNGEACAGDVRSLAHDAWRRSVCWLPAWGATPRTHAALLSALPDAIAGAGFGSDGVAACGVGVARWIDAVRCAYTAPPVAATAAPDTRAWAVGAAASLSSGGASGVYAYCCAGWSDEERGHAVAASMAVALALCGVHAAVPVPSMPGARAPAGRAAEVGALLRGLVDVNGGARDRVIACATLGALGRLARVAPAVLSPAAAAVEGGALVQMLVCGMLSNEPIEALRAAAISAVHAVLSAAATHATAPPPQATAVASGGGARSRVGSWLRGGGGGADKSAVAAAAAASDDAEFDDASGNCVSAGATSVAAPAWADAFPASGGYGAMAAALSTGPALGVRVVTALLEAIGGDVSLCGPPPTHPPPLPTAAATGRSRASTAASDHSLAPEEGGSLNGHVMLLVAAVFGAMSSETRVAALHRLCDVVLRVGRARAWLLNLHDAQRRGFIDHICAAVAGCIDIVSDVARDTGSPIEVTEGAAASFRRIPSFDGVAVPRIPISAPLRKAKSAPSDGGGGGAAAAGEPPERAPQQHSTPQDEGWVWLSTADAPAVGGATTLPEPYAAEAAPAPVLAPAPAPATRMRSRLLGMLRIGSAAAVPPPVPPPRSRSAARGRTPTPTEQHAPGGGRGGRARTVSFSSRGGDEMPVLLPDATVTEHAASVVAGGPAEAAVLTALQALAALCVDFAAAVHRHAESAADAFSIVRARLGDACGVDVAVSFVKVTAIAVAGWVSVHRDAWIAEGLDAAPRDGTACAGVARLCAAIAHVCAGDASAADGGPMFGPDAAESATTDARGVSPVLGGAVHDAYMDAARTILASFDPVVQACTGAFGGGGGARAARSAVNALSVLRVSFGVSSAPDSVLAVLVRLHLAAVQRAPLHSDWWRECAARYVHLCGACNATVTTVDSDARALSELGSSPSPVVAASVRSAAASLFARAGTAVRAGRASRGQSMAAPEETDLLTVVDAAAQTPVSVSAATPAWHDGVAGARTAWMGALFCSARAQLRRVLASEPSAHETAILGSCVEALVAALRCVMRAHPRWHASACIGPDADAVGDGASENVCTLADRACARFALNCRLSPLPRGAEPEVVAAPSLAAAPADVSDSRVVAISADVPEASVTSCAAPMTLSEAAAAVTASADADSQPAVEATAPVAAAAFGGRFRRLRGALSCGSGCAAECCARLQACLAVETHTRRRRRRRHPRQWMRW